MKSLYTHMEPVIHYWPMYGEGGETPPGASVWARTSAELISDGRMYRTKVGTHYTLHIAVRGCGTVRAAGQQHRVTAGDLFCHWPGEPIEWFEEPAQPWHLRWITVVGPGAQQFARACGFAPETPVLHPDNPSSITRAYQRLHAYYAQPGERNPYHALSLLYSLSASLRNKTVGTKGGGLAHSLVDRAQVLIESLVHTDLNITSLAQKLHVSRNTLVCAFRNTLNTTPIEYLRQQRLSIAKELLIQSDHKVSVIARAAGFATDKYFMRVFRKQEGMSPTAWRQKTKKT